MAKQLTPNEIHARMKRAYQTFQGAERALVAKADPRTGGNLNYALNWGNEESRAVIRRLANQWRAYDVAHRAAYKLATHLEHLDEAGRYLWCDHCKPVRRARQFIAA